MEEDLFKFIVVLDFKITLLNWKTSTRRGLNDLVSYSLSRKLWQRLPTRNLVGFFFNIKVCRRSSQLIILGTKAELGNWGHFNPLVPDAQWASRRTFSFTSSINRSQFTVKLRNFIFWALGTNGLNHEKCFFWFLLHFLLSQLDWG